MKIVEMHHLKTSDLVNFDNELKRVVKDFQTYGYTVEILYAITDEVYTALVIARE
jgi:hypothetical protein